MMKKTISLLLAITMLMGAVPVSAFADTKFAVMAELPTGHSVSFYVRDAADPEGSLIPYIAGGQDTTQYVMDGAALRADLFPPDPPAIGEGYVFESWNVASDTPIYKDTEVYANYRINDDPAAPRLTLSQGSITVMETCSAVVEVTVRNLEVEAFTISSSDESVIDAQSDIRWEKSESEDTTYIVTITPERGAAGDITLTFRADGAEEIFASARLAVTVTEASQPTVTSPEPVHMPADKTKTVAIEAQAEEPLTYTIQTPPVNGDASMAGNVLSYTPDGNAANETIKVLVSNGVNNAATTVEFVVYRDLKLSENPEDFSFAMEEDLSGGKTIPLTMVTDVLGREITFTLEALPLHGTVVIDGDQLIYTPAANYFGEDSFTLTAANLFYEVHITLNATITAVEDAPAPVDDTADVDSNSSVVIDVLATDEIIDTGSSLILSLDEEGLKKPEQALVCEIRDNKIFYKPDPFAQGTDTFEYAVAHEGGTLSAKARVTVTITSVNDPHTLQVQYPDGMEIAEDELRSFTVTLTDTDTLPEDLKSRFALRFVSTNEKVFSSSLAGYQPSYAFLSQTGNTIVYTVTWQPVPYANTEEQGPVSIQVFAKDLQDEAMAESPATQPVTVTPVNNAPQLMGVPAITQSVDEDNDYTLTFQVYDVDIADPKTFTLTAESGDQSVVTDARCKVTFVKQVDERTAEYKLVISPLANMFTSNEGLQITLTAYDDGEGEAQLSDTKSFTLVVKSVNDLPIANDNVYTLMEDETRVLEVLANDTDDDGHEFLEIVSVGACENGGTATIRYEGEKGYAILYTPAANYFGTDQFTYEIYDGDGAYSQATVSITITSKNDAPEFLNLLSHGLTTADVDTGYRTLEDTPMYTFTLYVTDVETDDEALMLQARIESGTEIAQSVYVQLVDPAKPQERVIEFVPKADQNGYVRLHLQLGDGETPVIQYIWVYVEPVNDPPVAATETVSFEEDSTIYIDIEYLLKNGSDVDMTTGLKTDSISLVPDGYDTVTTNGVQMTVVTIEDRKMLEYVSVPNSEKDDSFYYTIQDSEGATVRGKIVLNCIPDNDTPVVEFAPVDMEGQVVSREDEKFIITIDEDGVAQIKVNYFDYETARESLIVTVGSTDVTIVNAESFSWNADKTVLTIKPIANANGSVNITVTASDGYLNGNNSFQLNITSVPDAPTAIADEYGAVAGRLTVLSPLLNDYDVDEGDTVSLFAFGLPAQAKEAGIELVLNADGRTLSFLAPSGFEGAVEIPYTIVDSTGTKAESTITVTVTAFGTGPMILAHPAIIMTSLDGDVANITLEVVNVPAGASYQLTVTAENDTLLPDSCFSLAGGGNERIDLTSLATQLAITPRANTAGSTTINVTLTYDDKTDTIAIPIIITRDNNAPVANDDSYKLDPEKYTFQENTSPVKLNILDNDTDAQSPLNITILSIEKTKGPGTLTIAGDYKSVTYHPATSYSRYYYSGEVIFTYTIVDGGGKTDTATVTLDLTPEPTRPHAFGEYPIYSVSSANADALAAGEYKINVSSLWTNDQDYDDSYNSQNQKAETMKIVPKVTHICYEDSNGKQYEFSLNSDGTVDDRVVSFYPTQTGWYLFQYQVSTVDTDGETRYSDTVTAWIGITIDDQPIPPKVSGDTFYTDEDSKTGINRSVDGYIHAVNKTEFRVNLSEGYWVYENPSHAELFTTLELELDPDAHGGLFWLTAIPAPDMSGTATLKWMVEQEVNGVVAQSAMATFRVHIYPVNDAPVITLHPEDTGLDIQEKMLVTLRGDKVQLPVTITDIDNSQAQLRKTLVSSDEKYIFSDDIKIEHLGGDDYLLTFTPVNAPTDNPEDEPVTITLSVFDGEALVHASISVIILPKNNPPTAKVLHTATILEDAQGEFDVVSWGKDPDGDPLRIICDPDAETVDSVTGVAYITGVYFNGEGDSTDAYGYAQVDNKKIIFSPAKDYYTTGNDYIEIRYALADSEFTSNMGVIQLKITPQNDKPEIYGMKKGETMQEDVPKQFVFYADDIDGDNLNFRFDHDDDDGDFIDTISLVSAVKNEETGEWTITMEVTTQPDAYTHDTDEPVTVTVIVSDGKDEASQDVKLTILPVNDGLRLAEGYELPYRIQILEDHITPIDLKELFFDPEGDSISIVELRGAIFGSVVNSNNVAVFTPLKDYFTPQEEPKETGFGEFTFTVSDPYNGYVTSKVIIDILPVNDAPVANNFSVSANEDDLQVAIEVFVVGGSRAYDVDNELADLTLVSVSDVTSAQKGTVEISGRSILYYPNPDANGKDTFQYTIKDLGEDVEDPEDDEYATGTITVNIASDIDAPRIAFEIVGVDKDSWYPFPVLHDNTVWAMREDTPDRFAVRVWTPEENFNLSLRISVENEDGTEHKSIIPREKVLLAGANEDYTVSLIPLTNMHGNLWLVFSLSDGYTTVTRKVQVVVQSVNDLPVVTVTGGFEMNEDGDTEGTIRATDVETSDEVLEVYLVVDDEMMTGPENGEATASGNGKNGAWTYGPNKDYYGEDSFWIGVRDANGESTYEKITITVRPINDAPKAPESLEIDHANKLYKRDETIEVGFGPGSDDNVYMNETPVEDLTYEIQITYDGINWDSPEAGQVIISERSYDIHPDYSQDVRTFGVRVRTWDTVVEGTAAKESPWKELTNIFLDATAPVLAYALNPSASTKENVLITVTVTETGSGIATMDIVPVDGNTVTPVSVNGNVYVYEAQVNRDNYTFQAVDVAGNVSEYCVVKIDFIDKESPTISSDTESFDGSKEEYAEDQVPITLAYEDAPETPDYSSSGVVTMQYVLTESAEWPQSGWQPYPDGPNGSIILDAKGIWYIHARAVDLVGNISDNTFTFGPYVINNSPPTVPGDFGTSVSEELEGGKITVTFDLNEHVEDLDLEYGKQETLRFELDLTEGSQKAAYDKLTSFGTLAEDEEGVYTFTHNGEGSQPFQSPLEFYYTVTDNSDETAYGKVSIAVTEVNDAPNAPEITGFVPSVNLADTVAFKDGNTVTLTWTDTLTEGRVDEETDNEFITYNVYVSYNGGTSWTLLSGCPTASHTYESYVINNGGANTNQLQFYVAALDTGVSGTETYQLPKESEIPATRQSYSVDNRKPVASDQQSATAWTKEDITITLTVTDSRTGDSGVAQVATADGSVVLTENPSKPGEYLFTATQNGEYFFTATDNAGNAEANYKVTVTWIDKEKPNATPVPYEELLGAATAIYADDGKCITIEYKDVEGTSVNGMSEVKTKEYLLTTTQGMPSTGWLPYDDEGTGVPLDTKGIWYLYTRTVDNAGNVNEEEHGAYVVANSSPILEEAEIERSIYEEDLDALRTQTVTIDLNEYVSDPDMVVGTLPSSNEKLTFAYVQDSMPDALYGTFSAIGDGKCTFTYSGLGSDELFVPVLSFQYTAMDEDGDFVTGNVTLNVIEVNDAPSAPSLVKVTQEKHFMDDDQVTITWTDDLSVNGRVDEETDDEDIRYHVYVKYQSSDEWTLLTTETAGGPVARDSYGPYVIALGENRNTGELQFGVAAVDTGAGAGTEEFQKPKVSTITSSAKYEVDNTPPMVASKLSEDDWTKGPVDILLTVSDSRTGDSGVDKLLIKGGTRDGEVLTPIQGDADAYEYAFEITVNGTYSFTAVDQVGNVIREPHTVTITKIDRLEPSAQADLASITAAEEICAKVKSVGIDYTDQKPDLEGFYGKSDVKTRHYILTEDTTEPSADAQGWQPYTDEKIPLDTKGNWVLYSRTEDNAGNVNVQTLATYVIVNSIPIVEQTLLDFTIWEDTSTGQSNTFAIDLLAERYVRDVDGDELTITLKDVKWDEDKLGKLVEEGNGQYRFTHTGYGLGEFVSTLEFTFDVEDSDEETNHGTVTLHIREINDVPNAPINVKIKESEAPGPFQGGTEVTITWENQLTDGRVDEETDLEDLEYNVYYKYRNSDAEWTLIDTVPGTSEKEQTYTLNSLDVKKANTTELRFAVSITDAGVLAREGVLPPQTSEKAVSDAYTVDTTAPVISHTLNPDANTKGDVQITLVVEDQGVGATGIASFVLASGDGEDLVFVSKTENSPTKSTYVYIAKVNGTYTFTATDKVGNAHKDYSVPVRNIDKLEPIIEVTPQSILHTEQKYVTSGAEIEITYYDRPGDGDNIRTGIDTYEYALMPAGTGGPKEADWKTASNTAGNLNPNVVTVPLTTKGEWTLYVRATDNVGNTHTADYGTYFIRNSIPVISDIDLETTVHEQDDDGGNTTALIDLLPLLSDANGDSLEVTLTNVDWDQDKLGKLERLGNGKYSFAHTGDGTAEFDYALDFTYTVSDKDAGHLSEDDGRAIEGAVTINVVEFNDAPEAPESVSVAPASPHKGGTKVTISWSYPANARIDEETDAENMKYEVFVRYAAADQWVRIGTTDAGKTSMDYTLATENTTELAFAVEAIDAGIAANPEKGTDALAAKHSKKTESSTCVVDSNAPTITHVLDPNTATKDTVTIILTVTDLGVGATGVESLAVVYGGNEGDLMPVPGGNSETDGIYTYAYTAKVNGTYTFTSTDNVGNVSGIYQVEVNLIDSLLPIITANPTSLSAVDNVFAGEASVLLTYQDAEATAASLCTGIVTYEYALTHSKASPENWTLATNSTQALAPTASISLDTKGTWYLHARATDGVGNVTTRCFGSYVILNSVPVIHNPSLVLTVHEEEETPGSNKISIDLNDYVSDLDEDDLTFTILSKEWDTEVLGDLIPGQEEGQYSFTHSGEGQPFVDELTFTYQVEDGAGGVDYASVKIQVVEFNDAPKSPEGISVAPVDPYQGGTEVTVSWNPLNVQLDEETDNSAMVYEVFVKYKSDDPWVSIGTTPAGVTSKTYELQKADTTQLYFAVEATDEGVAENTETGAKALAPKTSEKAVSDAYTVDSTAPVLAYSLNPNEETNGTVEITITVKDLGVGATGVAGIALVDGDLVPVPGKNTQNAGVHTYVYTANVNGTYNFTATDQVGNISEVFPVPVQWIDMLPPNISADVEAITEEEAVYAKQRSILLTYQDDSDAGDNLSTGIKTYEYALSKSMETPSAWVLAENETNVLAPTARVYLNSEGTWYLHARATDQVGNVTTRCFGSYVILNNAPVIHNPSLVLTVHEEEETPGSNKVSVDLNDYASDLDGDDLTFTILSKDWDTEVLGDLIPGQEEGQYSFTHSGEGSQPFVDELTFTYQVEDGAGGVDDGSVKIKVVEFNDAPKSPVQVWLQEGDSVKDGTVTVEWQAVAGSQDRVDEETDNGDICYEVFVQYGASDGWTSLGTSPLGASAMEVTLEGGKNLSDLRFGVTATDQALSEGLPAKTSPRRESVLYTLDNTLPTLSYALMPNAPTNGNVTIKLTAVDSGAHAAGISSVSLLSGDATFLYQDGDDYYYEVAVNGTYTFQAEDAAGNRSSECPVPVQLIDKLAPTITPSLNEITVAEQVYIGRKSLALTYADAIATTEYLSTGVAVAQYALTEAQDTPGAWTDYSAAISLDIKGVWYLHVRSEDAVGNITGDDQPLVFGPYVILNNPPTVLQSDPHFTVHEEGDTDSTSISFNLNDYVQARALEDVLTFTITQQPDSLYGTLVKDGEGQYTFTHSGYGRQPFQSELVVKYKVADQDGAFSTGQVTLDVVQDNDAPNAPKSVALAESGSFRDGDQVNIRWVNTLTDGRVDEETDNASMVYDVYVKYEEAKDWTLLVRTAPGASSHPYTITGGITTQSLQFAVQAVDSALEEGILEAKVSALVSSPRYTVDNLPPQISVQAVNKSGEAYQMNSLSATALTLTIDYTDRGQSGLAEMQYFLTTAAQPGSRASYTSAKSEKGNKVEITAAGEYDLYLYARDNAGNETSEKIGKYCIQVEAVSQPTPTVTPTKAPANTPEPEIQLFTLTVYYWYDAVDSRAAASPYSKAYPSGSVYSVRSPGIPGWEAESAKVSGKITADTRMDVVYTQQTYSLTVYYLYTDGETAASTRQITNLPYGEAYRIGSPELDGSYASIAMVEGTMPARNLEITVVYSRQSNDNGDGLVNLMDYQAPLGLGLIVMSMGESME